MRRGIQLLAGVLLLCASSVVSAQGATPQEIAELRAQVAALMARLEALEAQSVESRLIGHP